MVHAQLQDYLKKKESALEASERGYRELIDQAGDVILKGTMQGDIIQANIAATRLLGWSNDELLQMNISNLFEPDILVKKPLRYDLLKQGATVLSERVFKAKDGQLIPVEMNSKMLTGGTLVTIARDLRERNASKKLLLAQHNQIKALFDATPVPMYAKDLNGRYILLNDAYLKFFGKTREEMLGKTVTEVWSTPSAKRMAEDDLVLLQHNEKQAYVTRLKDAREITRQVFIRKARYLNVNGEPAGFVGTLMDFTELNDAKNRYKTLFNNSPDPIVVHNGKILITANQAAVRFFDAENPDDYINSSLGDFIHPDSLKEAKSRIKALISSKQPNQKVSMKFMTASGALRDVEVMSVPIEYQDQVVIMSSFRDVTSEKTTRKALLDSEERYRRAFKYSPTAMVVHDEGFLLDANQAALNFIGAKRLKDVVGLDLFTLVHPDFIGAAREEGERLLKTKMPDGVVREQKYLTLQGEERWVEVLGVPINQADKTVILLSIIDIHDRVTIRDQLKKSQQQLEQITEHLTSYLFLVDLDLKVLYVNSATSKLLKSKHGNLLGKPLDTIIPKKEMDIGLSYLPRLLKGEVFSFQLPFSSPTGGEMAFKITLIPIKGENGDILALLLQMDDISEIEAAREELAENKDLLELIVDTIPGLFLYADLNERYLYVNKTYANWYGYTKSQVIGKNFNKIIPSEIYNEIQPYLSKISRGEQLSFSRKTKGPDGRVHDLDIRYIPHFDNNNKPKAFLASLQDVTEQKEDEVFRASLSQLARQLTVSLELREIGVIASSLLYDLFDHDAFSLYQINLAEDVAVPLYAEDTFVGTNRPVEVKIETNALTLENGVATFILPTPILVNRNEDDNEAIPAPFGDVTRPGLSLVFVPIFFEGEQIGTFTLHSYISGHFQEDDLPKLKIFANQIGGALVRAQADKLIKQQTVELQKRKTELEASIREKDVLLKEVYHRTKNNMQVIVGLLDMQGLKTSSEETQIILEEIKNQIYSMSMVHDLLYRSKNLAEIMLDTYLEKLVERLVVAYKTSSGEIGVTCQCDAIPVNIQTAIPLGLVINEIVSNALKHAFPKNQGGELTIKIKRIGKKGLSLEVGDNGVGMDAELQLDSADTLGLRIIHDIVHLQLLGEIKSSTRKGVKYIITIPNLKLD